MSWRVCNNIKNVSPSSPQWKATAFFLLCTAWRMTTKQEGKKNIDICSCRNRINNLGTVINICYKSLLTPVPPCTPLWRITASAKKHFFQQTDILDRASQVNHGHTSISSSYILIYTRSCNWYLQKTEQHENTRGSFPDSV